MHKKYFGLTVFQIALIALIVLTAGLAFAGVIHPAAAVLPLFGGSIAIRQSYDDIVTIKYTHNIDTTSGVCYLVNGIIMHAINSALANVENVFLVEGRIEYAKVAAQAWNGGDKIYWDDVNKVFTNVYAVGLTLAGCAAEAAPNPSTTGIIDLDCCLRAASSPSHSIVAAGISAAENDADGTVTVAIPGLKATDIATATLAAAANAVYVTKAVCSVNTLTISLSGNGGAGTQVNYHVARAVA